MNTNAEKGLDAYFKIRAAYISAFDRMLLERDRKGLESKWRTGEEVMDWWLHGGSDSDELTLLDDMEDEDENG
jgi:phosphoadenosine phosphosulfate reductase